MTTDLESTVSRPKGLSRGHFRRVAERGFGDGNNTYAYSCAWFDEHVYIGVTRYTLPLLAKKKYRNIPLDPFPVPMIPMKDMDLRGQIWRYSPARQVWELAFRSPMIDVQGHKIPLVISFRNMVVFQGKSDPGPALYTAPTQGLKSTRRVMLRSCDGLNFDEVSQPILKGEYGKWRSFRGLVPFKGRLFTSPAASQDSYATAMNRPDEYRVCGTAANVVAGASVRFSDDPASGKWQQSSLPDFGDPTNGNIFDLAVCGDYLYAGTLNVREGFQLWRTDGEGPGPHRWEKVLDRGADRGPTNQLVQSFAEFQGDLYLGTAIQNLGRDKINNIGPAGGEVIRVRPDGTWDIVVGEPRHTRQGFKVPTSGLGPGFGMIANGYFWRMCSHDGALYVGTGKAVTMWQYTDRGNWPDCLRRILDPPTLERFLELRGGAELWRTCDGDNWAPVTINGFDNRYNNGIRSLLSTPKGLFVGTTNLFGPKVAMRYPDGWRYERNPRGGLEVWQGSYEHHCSMQADNIKQDIRTDIHDSPAAALGSEHEQNSDQADPSEMIMPDDEDFKADVSLDAVTAALNNSELFDPFGRLAVVDADLEIPSEGVEDDIDRYFQGADARNVGYWSDGIHTPKDASEHLIHALVSATFERYGKGHMLSALVIGPGASGTASALLRLRDNMQVSMLAFDAAGAEELRLSQPRAKVVRSRRGKIKMRDGAFDIVIWVEGPGLADRVPLLREIVRVLKPGGTFAAADILGRQDEAVLSLPVDMVKAYQKDLKEAHLVDVSVADVTDKTWRPFFDHSRQYFRVKHLFDQIDRQRYERTLEALPGGSHGVNAYVMAFATTDRRAIACDSPMDLRDQVAVIIGGSAGIGLALARDLDNRGCRVVVASRSPKRVSEATSSLQHAVGFPNCDVTDPEAVNGLFDFVTEQFGRVDIAVISAGIGRGRNTPVGRMLPVVNMDEAEWDEVLDTNLRGTFLACRAVAPLMIGQGEGQIVSISSARGAVKGQACVSAYCASKMAARSMFHSLAAELQPHGIRVMSILPGAVDTTLIAGAMVGPRGAMQPDDVGEFIANMLAMPMDGTMVEPVVVPLGADK